MNTMKKIAFGVLFLTSTISSCFAEFDLINTAGELTLLFDYEHNDHFIYKKVRSNELIKIHYGLRRIIAYKGSNVTIPNIIDNKLPKAKNYPTNNVIVLEYVVGRDDTPSQRIVPTLIGHDMHGYHKVVPSWKIQIINKRGSLGLWRIE